MKNTLEIIKLNDKFALVSGHDTIKKGDKFINIRANVITVKNVEVMDGSLGYVGHMGHSFLCFREGVHFKFIKYITQTDLKKISIKKKYNTNNWSKHLAY